MGCLVSESRNISTGIRTSVQLQLLYRRLLVNNYDRTSPLWMMWVGKRV